MKKILLWMLVLVISISMAVSFSLAGCKKEAEEEVVEVAPTEEAAEEVAPTEEVSTEKIELVMFETLVETSSKLLDVYLQNFMDTNPNIIITRAHYDVEDMRDQFQNSAIAGSGPALMWGPHDWVGLLGTAGIVKNCNEIIGDVSRFNDGAITAVTYKGEILGIPLKMGGNLVLFYNTALIQEPPQTTDELIAKAKELTKGDVMGFNYVAKEPYLHIPFLTGYGGWPLTKDDKPDFDNEATVKSVKLVQDMISKHKIVNADFTGDEISAFFKDGKLAMTINGDWVRASYLEALGDKLAIAKIPKISDGGEPISMNEVQLLFLNNRLEGAELEAAKKVAEFMTSNDFQKYLYSEMKFNPVIKELLSDPSLKEDDPLMFKTLELFQYSEPMPNVPEMRVAWDAMFAGLNEAFSLRITPEETAKLMQEEANKKIEGMK